ncbi:hypothetical protein PLESTF_001012200 [Pleodorina starrii]|nr:hypothetical protein PLESTF_001012200 [Pleodorina starrii]
MSLLLALLRSPRTPATSRNRRDNGPHEIYTELGVFHRRDTELVELCSAAAPPTPATREVPGGNASPSLPSESRGEEHIRQSASNLRDWVPIEVAFALEYLTSSSAISVSVHEAFERLLWSGTVLCKLLSLALPGSLDERAVNESDGGLDVTASAALENFQLCHSCAQAQGCDVQGLTIEQLHSCEASYVTDFVLEILRVSTVQAIPAADRQPLVSPAPHTPRTAAAAASSAGGPAWGRAAPQRDGQAPSGHLNLHVPVNGGTAAAAAGEASGCAGQCPAIPQGTAAARRAAAGLERWVLQLVGTESPEPWSSSGSGSSSSSSPPGSSAPATPAVAPGASPFLHVASVPALQLSPGLFPTGGSAPGPLRRSWTVTGPTPSGCGRPAKDLLPRFDGRAAASCGGGEAAAAVGPSCVAAPADLGTPTSVGSASRSERQVQDRALAGGSTAAGAADSEVVCANEPDPVGVAVWERLAALLSRPANGGVGTGASRAAPSSQLAEGPPGSASQGPPQASLARSGTLGQAPAGPRLEVPGATAVDDHDDEQARWAAAAAALSAAFAAAPTPGSPLPALRAEHLQCRHPGLRSLLLARALLAFCRHRDGPLAPSTAAAVTATDAARASNGSGSCGSGDSQDGSGTASPSSGTAGAEAAEGAAAAAAAAVAAAAAAAAKMLPAASPAPPLPPLRHTPSASGNPLRRHHSTSARQPMDNLSEHNLLVQQEHQQRDIRRQQRQQQHRSGGGERPGPGVGTAGGETKAVLWSGDGDDEEGEDQEERVLRRWLNSLDPGIHVASLFELEVTTGWPLLLALEAIQPGCVPRSDAFRPPFKEKLRKILSVQNCNLVIEVCTRQLAMPPLVNIGGLDLALGQRRATLSLVFQMMRHHMGMLLGLAAPNPPASPHYTAAAAVAGTPNHHHQLAHGHSFGHGFSHGYGYGHDASPHGHLPMQLPVAPSPQRGTRAYVEVEKAVLAWANAKLTEAALAAAAAAPTATAADSGDAAAAAAVVAPRAPFTPLASFSDKRLGEGRVLLQLLAAICPRSVNPKYVLPGRNEEERGSNARYLLSCARKLGCVIFLAWEDVVAARPNLLLFLLASFMALDRKRAGAAAAAMDATAMTPPPVTVVTAAVAAVLGGEVTAGPRMWATQAPAGPPV